jgi:hypothetical protein
MRSGISQTVDAPIRRPSGMRIGTPDQSFREDIEQRDKATQIVALLPIDSIEHQSFTSLASTAESQIRWQLDRDDRLSDRRTW